MRGTPIHPDEYDGEHLNTDAKLEAEGWAAGLRVWEQVSKGYGNYLGDDTLGNAQLWSLRNAIRAECRAELLAELLAPAGLDSAEEAYVAAAYHDYEQVTASVYAGLEAAFRVVLG
jgi:hypothetical protein